jgi:hypothetical protein
MDWRARAPSVSSQIWRILGSDCLDGSIVRRLTAGNDIFGRCARSDKTSLVGTTEKRLAPLPERFHADWKLDPPGNALLTGTL